MKVLVLFALTIASASAGFLGTPDVPIHPHEIQAVSTSIDGRITNGLTASPGQFPYIVGLSFASSGGDWWCGGSIIDNSWILTAAHCTSGASSVTIFYGSTVRTQAELTLTVPKSNFIQHVNYDSSIPSNDISLIKTPAVPFSSTINKVRLPAIGSSSNNGYEGLKAVASGWGKISENATSMADTLQYETFEILSVFACQEAYGPLIASLRVICVATPNKISTCNGDSGGPLVLVNEEILAGVASFVSAEGCETGAPAGFTRVYSYLTWIKQNSGVSY